MIYVHNRSTYRGPGVKVFRGHLLGNRYVIGRDGDRATVIAKFRRWLWAQLQVPAEVAAEVRRLAELHRRGEDIHLICCCVPDDCHAFVIKAAIEWMAMRL